MSLLLEELLAGIAPDSSARAVAMPSDENLDPPPPPKLMLAKPSRRGKVLRIDVVHPTAGSNGSWSCACGRSSKGLTRAGADHGAKIHALGHRKHKISTEIHTTPAPPPVPPPPPTAPAVMCALCPYLVRPRRPSPDPRLPTPAGALRCTPDTPREARICAPPAHHEVLG